MAGVEAYLDYCLDDTYRRLVLEEAPVVLGWTWSRDCESMVMMRVTEVTLGALMADGIIVEQPLDMLTRVAHGTIGQLAFSILESEDRAQARIDAGRLIRRLFEALRPETVPAPPRQGARSRRRSG
jgi:hypothetical protein